eukprot:2700046-Pleurochrysis_carterae.AAC.1
MLRGGATSNYNISLQRRASSAEVSIAAALVDGMLSPDKYPSARISRLHLHTPQTLAIIRPNYPTFLFIYLGFITYYENGPDSVLSPRPAETALSDADCRKGSQMAGCMSGSDVRRVLASFMISVPL